MNRNYTGMSTHRVTLSAGLLALIVAVAAWALSVRAAPLLSIDEQAFDVAAARVDIDADTGAAVLEGGVTARFGDVEVRADKVELRYDLAPRVSWARGTGSVSARLKGIDATATAVEFDAKSHSVVLSGAVRLTRGKGWVTAERATMDLSTNKVSLQEVKGSIPVRAAGSFGHP